MKNSVPESNPVDGILAAPLTGAAGSRFMGYLMLNLPACGPIQL
jgi:hypothetical protein